ncbi:MAG: hypothetical protein ACRD13_02575, partial [Terriglobales bacterium]
AAAPVHAYAVRHGGEVTVFVVNHDLAGSVPVQLAFPRRFSRARLLWLRAPGYASRDVTYGGRRFSPQSGRLDGPPRWRRQAVRAGAGGGAAAGSSVRFTLPEAAVAILRLR